jgi:cytoskeletal protein RodZ
MSKFTPTQEAQLKEIGSYLRQRRLTTSLSLEEIADSTYIRLPTLRAIENGQVDQLPELVYVQGFIRRYGEVLQLDGEALAKTLTQPQAAAPPQPPAGVSSPPPEMASEPVPLPARELGKFWLYLLAVLLVSGIGGLLYFFSRPPASQPSASPTPSAVVQSSATPATALKPQPRPQEDSLSITLKLEGDSWLQVKVDGQTSFEGILKQGTQKTWKAEKQLQLRAGNAGAIILSINQKPPQRLGNPGEVKELILTPSSTP